LYWVKHSLKGAFPPHPFFTFLSASCGLKRQDGGFLSPAAHEAASPIQDSPSRGVRLIQLGGDLLIGDPLAALTHDRSCWAAFSFGRIVDDRVLGDRFLAAWTYDLVSHFSTLFRASGILLSGYASNVRPYGDCDLSDKIEFGFTLVKPGSHHYKQNEVLESQIEPPKTLSIAHGVNERDILGI
jgi:hypothetical protein